MNTVLETRKALKLSQREMADAIGVSFTTARRCEYESRLPTSRAAVANLRKLAARAGVEMEAPANGKKAASTRAEVKP
jgi:transcriptional regulator with XRE-family HTH domain